MAKSGELEWKWKGGEWGKRAAGCNRAKVRGHIRPNLPIVSAMGSLLGMLHVLVSSLCNFSMVFNLASFVVLGGSGVTGLSTGVAAGFGGNTMFNGFASGLKICCAYGLEINEVIGNFVTGFQDASPICKKDWKLD